MFSNAPPPAPDRIGRYRIERKIGEGGMGIVYAARDERLERTVALKTIRGGSDEAGRRRVWREARAAAGISHPNICQLFEVEETDDGLVLAMELLEGEPLGARLARGPLSPVDSSAMGRSSRTDSSPTAESRRSSLAVAGKCSRAFAPHQAGSAEA